MWSGEISITQDGQVAGQITGPATLVARQVFKMRHGAKQPRGFTLLELQISIILLAMGLATLSSLVTTQSRSTASFAATSSPARRCI